MHLLIQESGGRGKAEKMCRNIRKVSLDPIVILTLIGVISLLILAVFAPLIAPMILISLE